LEGFSQIAAAGNGLFSPLEPGAGGFGQMILDWAGFFGALAQVSGGLVGLVFVSLTFNSKALGVGSNPLLRALAEQTFADFLLLLLISLVMLVPHTSAGSVGPMFVAFSAADTVRTMRSMFRLRTGLRALAGGWRIAQRFVLSGVGHLMILSVGIELMRGNAEPGLIGSLLFSGIVVLLLAACRSAWLLLVHTES